MGCIRNCVFVFTRSPLQTGGRTSRPARYAARVYWRLKLYCRMGFCARRGPVEAVGRRRRGTALAAWPGGKKIRSLHAACPAFRMLLAFSRGLEQATLAGDEKSQGSAAGIFACPSFSGDQTVSRFRISAVRTSGPGVRNMARRTGSVALISGAALPVRPRMARQNCQFQARSLR